MGWQQPPYAAAMLLSAVASTAAAAYALRNRDASGAVPLAAIMLGAAVWTVANTLQVASLARPATLFWANLRYVGIVAIPAAWLVFALEYTGSGDRVTPRTLGALLVEPVLVLALVWTNPAHHLYWTSLELTTVGGFVVLERTHGIAFWIHVAYSYLVLGVGTALIVRMFLTADHLYRSQAVAILVGLVVPWLGNAAFLAGFAPPGIDPTPVAFVVTGLAFTWAVFRHELLDVVPVARELARQEVIESMIDPVVVVDDRGRVVDLNPAAEGLLDRTAPDVVGEPLIDVLPALADVFDPDGRSTAAGAGAEVALERHDVTRYFDVRVSPLSSARGSVSGHLAILRDVTDRERHRQRLAVLNRVLRHDLRNDLNVLVAHTEDLIAGADDPAAKARQIKEKALGIAALSDRARELERTLAGDEVVLERLDVVRIVERAAADVGRDYPAAAVTTDLPDRAEVRANALLDSAVENLVENAAEHNDRPEPTIEVSVSVPGNGAVEIVVADDGPGIPEEERAVLESGTETPLDHSSGLGLWLINWIVTESGGEIRFDENEPRGAVVAVTLPAAGAGAGPPAREGA